MVQCDDEKCIYNNLKGFCTYETVKAKPIELKTLSNGLKVCQVREEKK